MNIDASQDLGATDARSVLAVLFDKASAALTADELRHLARAEQCAAELAHNAAELASGVAALVVADGSAAGRSGNFQDADEVGRLAFHFASVFGHIEGLLMVASNARHQLAALGAEGGAA